MSRKLIGKHVIITNTQYSLNIRGKIGQILEYDDCCDFFGIRMENCDVVLFMSPEEIKIINDITFVELLSLIKNIRINKHK